eukprot:m51a1_g11757 putative adenylate guanylate cyclase (580) ;mRNA; r:207841-209635
MKVSAGHRESPPGTVLGQRLRRALLRGKGTASEQSWLSLRFVDASVESAYRRMQAEWRRDRHRLSLAVAWCSCVVAGAAYSALIGVHDPLCSLSVVLVAVAPVLVSAVLCVTCRGVCVAAQYALVVGWALALAAVSWLHPLMAGNAVFLVSEEGSGSSHRGMGPEYALSAMVMLVYCLSIASGVMCGMVGWRTKVALVALSDVFIVVSVAAIWSWGHDLDGMRGNLVILVAGSLLGVLPAYESELHKRDECVTVSRMQREHTGILKERQRCDRLLDVALPVGVALIIRSRKLRAVEDDVLFAQSCTDVGVLHLEVLGLSSLSADREYLQHLSNMLGTIEMLVLNLSCERIYTAGTCVLIASGVPESVQHSSVRIGVLALRLASYVESYGAMSGLTLGYKICVGTGSVVAGVMGKTIVKYDVWGNTVIDLLEMARRVEKNVICVTRSFKDHVSSHLLTEEVKSGGEYSYCRLISEAQSQALLSQWGRAEDPIVSLFGGRKNHSSVTRLKSSFILDNTTTEKPAAAAAAPNSTNPLSEIVKETNYNNLNPVDFAVLDDQVPKLLDGVKVLSMSFPSDVEKS